MAFGPCYVLEFDADTFSGTSIDNVVLELMFGPSYLTAYDQVWKYPQNIDFEHQGLFKAVIWD